MTKLARFHDDLLAIFLGAGPCRHFTGADASTDCRTDCQSTRPRFVWAN